MTWYLIAGDWQQFTALVKLEWDKLTDDDLTTFSGQSEQLAGLLQRKYGYGESRRTKKSRRSPIKIVDGGLTAPDGARRNDDQEMEESSFRIRPAARDARSGGGLRRM